MSPRPTYVSPMFSFWIMHSLYCSSLGRYVPWTNRPLDEMSLGYVTCIIHPTQYHALFIPLRSTNKLKMFPDF